MHGNSLSGEYVCKMDLSLFKFGPIHFQFHMNQDETIKLNSQWFSRTKVYLFAGWSVSVLIAKPFYNCHQP